MSGSAAHSFEQSTTTAGELYGFVFDFAAIAFVYIIVYVLTRFFVSHWIFRWRTAMNDYYMAHWGVLRRIEGASQRVQEDTMRFASVMEGLGVSLIDSLMTLIAFFGSSTVTGPRYAFTFSARMRPSSAHSAGVVRINVTCGLCW